MGYIYLITCLSTLLMYVGQTDGPYNIRWSDHQNCGRRLKRFNDGAKIKLAGSIKSSRLYRAMARYGVDNFKFEVLIEVNDSQLDYWETRYIEKLGTLSPGGYNLTSGGGHFKHHEETKQLMSKLAKEKAPELIDKFRNPELIGIPMNIVMHNKGESKGVAICEHELCSYKSFTIDEYGDLDKAKAAAIKFLDDLVKSGVKHDCNIKADKALRLGITRFRKGYKVRRKINKVWYSKTFEDKTKTLEQLLVLAEAYLDEINKLE